MKKQDIFLLIVILLLSAGIFAAYRLFYHADGDFVTVTVDGQIYCTLPLDKDTTREIPGVNGGVNVLEIKDHAASITSADCPDKLCVHQKKIEKQGETLVCLPHKVIIQVTSHKESSLDDIAN